MIAFPGVEPRGVLDPAPSCSRRLRRYLRALAEGGREGKRKVEQAVANAGKAINGWRVGSAGGDAAFYNGWLKRAAVAQFGIYANDAAEAMYPFTRNDADGQPLEGARHRYTLTFPPGGLPPVNAFWSVTMYEGRSQLLIKNPIDRRLINSPMLPGMTTAPDPPAHLALTSPRSGPRITVWGLEGRSFDNVVISAGRGAALLERGGSAVRLSA